MIYTRHEYIGIITKEILDCMSEYEEYCNGMRNCEEWCEKGQTRESLDDEWWNQTKEEIYSLLNEFRYYCFMSDEEYDDIMM